MNKQEYNESISLCEAIDRVLNKGVVLTADVVISVADIDLIYLKLNLLLSSVETAHNYGYYPKMFDCGL